MSDEPGRSLDERVAQLEARVRDLESQLARARAQTPVPLGTGLPARPARGGTRGPKIPEQLKDVRYWFRVLGIGLLLLGTAFIFKYSEDEGSGIMTLRVSVGAAMGLGLIAIGYRMRDSERHFSSVLSGGGIAVWYITGFAAFQVFDLIAALPAFAFMTVVTILAFLLAMRQDVIALSVIGALGGLGTPWLLYETDRALAGPVVYMCLVLAGSLAVYLKKGWKALMWSSALVAGGAFVAIGAQYYVDSGQTDERLTLQVGIAFYWLVFALAPVLREVRRPRNPEVEAVPQPVAAKTRSNYDDLPMFVTLVAIYGVGMTTATWDPNLRIGGWVGIITAAAYLFAWRRIEVMPGLTTLARAHLLAALVLVTTGISVLLDGEVLLITLAAEAAALHFLSHRTTGILLPIWAHLVYFVIGFVVLGRLIIDSQHGMPIINGDSLANLWVIVSGVAASFVMRSPRERFAYRYAAHGLALIWVLRELHGLPNGQGIVSAVWGVYAIALVIAGFRINSTKLRVLGMVTLVVTVLKLVIVDLSEVKAIWRVLLFSVFGIVLLALSHWTERFRKRIESTHASPDADDPTP